MARSADFAMEATSSESALSAVYAVTSDSKKQLTGLGLSMQVIFPTT